MRGKRDTTTRSRVARGALPADSVLLTVISLYPVVVPPSWSYWSQAFLGRADPRRVGTDAEIERQTARGAACSLDPLDSGGYAGTREEF